MRPKQTDVPADDRGDAARLERVELAHHDAPDLRVALGLREDLSKMCVWVRAATRKEMGADEGEW